jgi:hypothetical protein
MSARQSGHCAVHSIISSARWLKMKGTSSTAEITRFAFRQGANAFARWSRLRHHPGMIGLTDLN